MSGEWPDGVPQVPSQARKQMVGDNIVYDMPYQRWWFSPAGLVSFTQFNGTTGVTTKGPASP